MTTPESAADDLPTGYSTMSPAMGDMQAYPRYLYGRVIRPLKDRVWEIGVGYGRYTQWLLEAGKTVLATDIDQHCLQEVQRKFADQQRLSTALVDLTDETSVRAQTAFQANSLICLNVLEHIEDDVTALRWIRESVTADAVMGLIVPAHQWLFGRMDSEAGHFRRYTRRSLTAAFESAGWKVEQTRYLNAVSAAGWWYHNRLRKDAGIADESVNSQMRRADQWLPRIARLTDPVLGRIAGLSVMAIAHAGGKG